VVCHASLAWTGRQISSQDELTVIVTGGDAIEMLMKASPMVENMLVARIFAVVWLESGIG